MVKPLMWAPPQRMAFMGGKCLKALLMMDTYAMIGNHPIMGVKSHCSKGLKSLQILAI